MKTPMPAHPTMSPISASNLRSIGTSAHLAGEASMRLKRLCHDAGRWGKPASPSSAIGLSLFPPRPAIRLVIPGREEESFGDQVGQLMQRRHDRVELGDFLLDRLHFRI